MAQVATRLKRELLEELKLIEEVEKKDRAAVLRNLIATGVRHWKLEYALKLYTDQKATTWKAAELAGLSLYEFIEVLRSRRIPAQFTTEDLEEDLRSPKG
jgi:predicted HTH domain antitoxin